MQQTKINLNSKTNMAIISFIVGIVNLTILMLLSPWSPEWITEFLLKKQKLTAVSVFMLSLVGIILGMIGIKSEKKSFAIGGIIFSIIALIRIIPGLIFVLFYSP